MNDSIALYSASIDAGSNTLTLAKPRDKNWRANFAYRRVAHDQLVLDGEMDGQRIHADLHLFDRNKFPLVRHRIRWIEE
jgi:hypothetical protein